MQMEAAERRRIESEKYGIKDPDKVKRMQQRAAILEANELEATKQGAFANPTLKVCANSKIVLKQFFFKAIILFCSGKPIKVTPSTSITHLIPLYAVRAKYYYYYNYLNFALRDSEINTTKFIASSPFLYGNNTFVWHIKSHKTLNVTKNLIIKNNKNNDLQSKFNK